MSHSSFSSDIDMPDLDCNGEINDHCKKDSPHTNHSQCCGSINEKPRARRKLPRDRALSLSRTFVPINATQTFLETWETTLVAWVSLLRATRLPPNKAITALNLNAPVQRIDRVIAGEYKNTLPPRFGYVRLFDFLECLKFRVKRDKAEGLIAPKNGHVNAAHAYNIYRNAQGTIPAKYNLRLYRQIGGRWKKLTGPSILLLTIFSKTAESFAMYPAKADNSTFDQMAFDALRDIPERIRVVCDHLMARVEQAVDSGMAGSNLLEGDIRAQVKMYLA